jgi:hypothetical protein
MARKLLSSPLDLHRHLRLIPLLKDPNNSIRPSNCKVFIVTREINALEPNCLFSLLMMLVLI